MHAFRTLAAVMAATGLLVACGDDAGRADRPTNVSIAPATESLSVDVAESPASRAEVVVPTESPQLDRPASATSAGRPALDQPANVAPAAIQELDQPAIWPSADVVFATPEEAAADFVEQVLGVEPELGEFQAGDSRSGEIVVFSLGDSAGAVPLERALLGLRQIGPTDGWFVIAASSPGAFLNTPETLDEVAAGPLLVEGEARGFESTVVVSAFRAGDADAVLDSVITAGGAFADLEPFSVTLDLSDAAPGDVIAVLVRGDTGLETDTGDFTSIPIVIADVLPSTR